VETENINYESLKHNEAMQNPIEINDPDPEQKSNENIVCVESSFDSYLDTFKENLRGEKLESESNHEICLEKVNDEEMEIDEEFNDFFEIFEDFEANEKKEIIDLTKEESKNEDGLKTLAQKNNFEEIFNFTNKSTNIKEYTFIKNISKGGYGVVDLYRKNSTGDDYIIKSVDINFMVT
jgi:hypothetical protein